MIRLYDTNDLKAKVEVNNNETNKFPEDGILKSSLQQSIQKNSQDSQLGDLIAFLDNLMPPQLKAEISQDDQSQISIVQSPVVSFINQIKQMTLEQEKLKRELEELKNPEYMWKGYLLQQLLDEDDLI